MPAIGVRRAVLEDSGRRAGAIALDSSHLPPSPAWRWPYSGACSVSLGAACAASTTSRVRCDAKVWMKS